MRLFLFVGLLFLPLLASSQTAKEEYLDSLQQVLKNIRNLEKEQRDSDILGHKVEVLCLLAREYDGVDSTKTFNFALEALKFSKENKYGKGIVDANFTLGRALMYIDQRKAVTYLEKGNKLANQLIKSDSSIPFLKIWANGTYNLGLTYGSLGKHQKEIEITDTVNTYCGKIG